MTDKSNILLVNSRAWKPLQPSTGKEKRGGKGVAAPIDERAQKKKRFEGGIFFAATAAINSRDEQFRYQELRRPHVNFRWDGTSPRTTAINSSPN